MILCHCHCYGGSENRVIDINKMLHYTIINLKKVLNRRISLSNCIINVTAYAVPDTLLLNDGH